MRNENDINVRTINTCHYYATIYNCNGFKGEMEILNILYVSVQNYDLLLHYNKIKKYIYLLSYAGNL